jgi:hypothetical protein
METFNFSNSSAICKVILQVDDNIVGVAFTSNPDKEYLYLCEDIEEVKSKILQTKENKSSIGKLINQFKKEGILVNMEEIENKT